MAYLTKEEMLKVFAGLSTTDLEKVWAIYRETRPCPLCGKPVGSTRRKYCKQCSNKRKHNNLKKAYAKYYSRKGSRQKLKKRYSPLITPELCLLSGFTQDEILDSINLIITEYHLKGWSKEQTLAASLIYLIRKNKILHSLPDVANWIGISSRTANSLWKKIKLTGPCKEAHQKYLKSLQSDTYGKAKKNRVIRC